MTTAAACRKCGGDKPNDGKCRPCAAAAARERYHRDPEKYRQRERERRERMGRDAYNEHQREYRAKEPEKHSEWAKEKNLARFGLTPEGFEELLESQDGGCAICGRTAPS